MKSIVKWLIGVESEAGLYYRAAAKKFQGDRELSAFAGRLADEEEAHCTIMKNAAEVLDRKEQISPLTLDDATKKKIEDSLMENGRRLAESNFTHIDFYNSIVEMEYSEWNRIFLFVVNALKGIDKQFAHEAAEIQRHLKGIEEFLASRPECREHCGRIRSLPPVWQGRILVVEDDGLVSEFLKVALEDLGVVDVAWNGEEALDKMTGIRYDVIVCDVVMPKMNGVEFFTRATAREPEISGRFLFLTGFADDERLSFLRGNNLPFILKPAPIGKIKLRVRDIMLKSARR